MKKIIITESQLSLLFEQTIAPEDQACFDQLTDDNGTKYHITTIQQKENKDNECASKPSISSILPLVQSVIDDGRSYYYPYGSMCALVLQSKNKRSWDDENQPFFSLSLWDTGIAIITYMPYLPVEGGGKKIEKIVWYGDYNDDGDISNLNFKHVITQDGEQIKNGFNGISGDIEIYINATTKMKIKDIPFGTDLSWFVTNYLS